MTTQENQWRIKGGPAPLPLFVDQTEARRAEKKIFEKNKNFTDSLSERVNWVHCMSLIGFADWEQDGGASKLRLGH